MALAALPADGYTTEDKLQVQVGWWYLEMTCVVTDTAGNVFTKTTFVSANVQGYEGAPKVDAALIERCGEKLKALMEHEVSDEARSAQLIEKLEQIDMLKAERDKIVNHEFDDAIGVRDV